MLLNAENKELHYSVCLIDLVPDLSLSGKNSLGTVYIYVYVSCILSEDDTGSKLSDPAGEFFVDASVLGISNLL